MKVAVVIPALNEAGHIAALVQETLLQAVDWVIVVDNGSTDETGALARQAGAQVVYEPRRGYGSACLAGSTSALNLGAEVIVYLDGDYSALPTELPRLLTPLQAGRADLVLGSRVLGQIASGAMPSHQRVGNQVFATLVRLLYSVRLTDAGPYRAIRATLLHELNLQESTFGWPTEMTVKAAKRKARIVEVPISWHSRRTGVSKVGGTLRGSLLASYHILRITLRYTFE
jgi:glycosyltransferase involved in cell wall biosynthesis